MTASNKEDFLFKLHSELHRIGVEDDADIFADFEEHFRASAEQGYTEEETCARLGDVKEIARNYIDIESTAINSIIANAVEESRPHVSLKKPGRDVPAASAAVEAAPEPAPAIAEQPAPIRELTPEHIAVEPSPVSAASAPRINIQKPAAPAAPVPPAAPVTEITPQHTAQEQAAAAIPTPVSSENRTSGATPTYTAPQPQQLPPQPKTEAQKQPRDTSHMAELPPQTEAEKKGFSFADIKGRNLDINIGKLVGMICLDIFVFSWAIPTLASLIVAFIGTAVIGTGGAAIAQFAGANHFHLLSRIFLGTGLGSLCVLMSCLGVKMVKGFIHIIKSIVIAHIKALYDL